MHRPAIDPLFRSAAVYYGPRSVAVLLSGNLDDGTAGLLAIKQRGGIAIVQDPEEALFPDMPRNALAAITIDHVLSIGEMSSLIFRLAQEQLQPTQPREAPSGMKEETAIEQLSMAAIENEQRDGVPSVFACPDCGGTLWDLNRDEVLRFRCRVGHAYTAESLMTQQGGGIEAALWSALRALEENAALSRRVAERARKHDRGKLGKRFEAKAREAEEQARTIRAVIASRPLEQKTAVP